MQNHPTEYICVVNFDKLIPDPKAWRAKLAELGLGHESFLLSVSPTGKPVVKFWEPDRPEALRILAKLDGLTARVM